MKWQEDQRLSRKWFYFWYEYFLMANISSFQHEKFWVYIFALRTDKVQKFDDPPGHQATFNTQFRSMFWRHMFICKIFYFIYLFI